jgi:hypothetical protein
MELAATLKPFQTVLPEIAHHDLDNGSQLAQT